MSKGSADNVIDNYEIYCAFYELMNQRHMTPSQGVFSAMMIINSLCDEIVKEGIVPQEGIAALIQKLIDFLTKRKKDYE